MKKINFAFGIHNHQPVGNFDFVFEHAFNHSYNPLLKAFAKFPEFKVNLHYSGILLDWIEQHHPEHFEIIKEMVQKGQAEILSGGFYEPILAVIPEYDGIGQIKKENEYIKKHFNYKPSGMWLAERVWEPTLPRVIKKADIDYTVIDDAHFRYAGLKQEDLWGYYITEELGYQTYLFPISQKLRYTIPFEDPQVTIDFLKEIATEDGNRLILFADDGEKFGVWPGTYDHVYKEKWLEKFIELMLKNSDWINIVHFSEALKILKPLGTIYLPTASYAEMMHWALPAKSFKDYEDFETYLKKKNLFDEVNVFVRGGFWRNFLSKYSESNNMHKKMLYLTQRVEKLQQKTRSSLLKKAKDHIWAGQCNCPYWHGVFGGLYLNHLRNAIYQNLIEAEKLINKVEKKLFQKIEKIKNYDINKDGFEEILVESKNFSLYITPEFGGKLYELDYKPKNRNFLDTLTRREEGYHQKLVELALHANEQKKDNEKEVASIHDMLVAKEKGLEKYLNYDWYEKKSFIDHFLEKNITREEFYKVQYKELGDFVNQEYMIKEKKFTGNLFKISLQREGNVWFKKEFFPILLTKEFILNDKDQILFTRYRLKNLSGKTLELRFGIELNFGMLAGQAPDRYYVSKDYDLGKPYLNTHGELIDTTHLGIVDESIGTRIDIISNKNAHIWYFPIETISLSESGFERVYQSSNVVYIYDLTLEKTWNVTLETKFISLA